MKEDLEADEPLRQTTALLQVQNCCHASLQLAWGAELVSCHFWGFKTALIPKSHQAQDAGLASASTSMKADPHRPCIESKQPHKHEPAGCT